MAKKALTLFIWFVMISVVCLPQTTTAQTGGGGGSHDENDRNKVAVRGSNSQPAGSKTESTLSGSGPLESSKKECTKSTSYSKSCSGNSSAMECHTTVTRTTCSGTTVTEKYSSLETPPPGAGNFEVPPPIGNRKLLWAFGHAP